MFSGSDPAFISPPERSLFLRKRAALSPQPFFSSAATQGRASALGDLHWSTASIRYFFHARSVLPPKQAQRILDFVYLKIHGGNTGQAIIDKTQNVSLPGQVEAFTEIIQRLARIALLFGNIPQVMGNDHHDANLSKIFIDRQCFLIKFARRDVIALRAGNFTQCDQG